MSEPPDRFEEWWALWPKKVSKGQAVRAWKAATKKADAQAIIDGLRAQMPKLTEGDPKFIPYPATWLNGERWADEVAATLQSAADRERDLLWGRT